MNERWFVTGTVVIILLLTLATGPIGLYAVPTESQSDLLGDGDATITVVSAPDTMTLAPSRYDTGEYHLRVPTVVIDIQAVTGNPIVNYNVAIPELGVTKTTVHSIGDAGDGEYQLSFIDSSSPGDAQVTAIDASKVDQQRYDARITIVLRGDGTERVIYDETAVVEVVE